MIGHRPAVRNQLSLGQESLLNLIRQIQIALQGALLGRRQMVDAVPAQRIKQQPIVLDRIMTRLTNAVRTGLHSLQGGIHFTKKCSNALSVGGGRNGAMEPFSSGQKLLPQSGVSNDVGGLGGLHLKLFHG
jgi:hypothetical protein